MDNFDNWTSEQREEAITACKKFYRSASVEMFKFFAKHFGLSLLAVLAGVLIMGAVNTNILFFYCFSVSILNYMFLRKNLNAKLDASNDIFNKTLIEISNK